MERGPGSRSSQNQGHGFLVTSEELEHLGGGGDVVTSQTGEDCETESEHREEHRVVAAEAGLTYVALE